MIRALLQRLKQDVGLENVEDSTSVVDEHLILTHGKLEVARVGFDGKTWTFEYTDAFRAQSTITPLPDFPDVHHKYSSEDAWAFLLSRLPSPSRSDIRQILQKENISPTDIVALLRRFGEKSVSSPFDLKAA
ncbi:MAG: hypothetical protein JSS89_03980 [Bacteroidetes bacterium]|nr:hypothetical protein [Bacteroidota bacterium]